MFQCTPPALSLSLSTSKVVIMLAECSFNAYAISWLYFYPHVSHIQMPTNFIDNYTLQLQLHGLFSGSTRGSAALVQLLYDRRCFKKKAYLGFFQMTILVFVLGKLKQKYLFTVDN